MVAAYAWSGAEIRFVQSYEIMQGRVQLMSFSDMMIVGCLTPGTVWYLKPGMTHMDKMPFRDLPNLASETNRATRSGGGNAAANRAGAPTGLAARTKLFDIHMTGRPGRTSRFDPNIAPHQHGWFYERLRRFGGVVVVGDEGSGWRGQSQAFPCWVGRRELVVRPSGGS
jgi:hypothetical protein